MTTAKKTTATASKKMELQTVASEATLKAQGIQKFTATAYAGTKAVYDRKAKEYTEKASYGIKLELTDSGLTAIVSGIRVGIGVENGKCTLKAYAFDEKKARKLDADSKALKKGKQEEPYKAACRYIEAKYSITQREYADMVKLARSGVALMTKAERKAAKAEEAKKAC